MNEHDSERIAGLLTADGMEHTDDVDEADVVVFNTCCVRENADNKLYGQLGRLKGLKERRPDLQIAVGGCLAQKDRDLIVERAGHVDVVFGTHNLAHAPALLERARLEGPIVEILEEHEAYPSALPARRDVAHSAWVTIQIGCDNSCTFCIVPIVRGREVSRRMGDIVREIEELAADGVTEITLLGQNVNSYGRDLGAGQYAPRFADLLRAVDAVDGIRRIRYTSPHPKDLRPETIAAMAECGAVCEHLHLPLQAGSDRTLARMHRGYTAQRYLREARRRPRRDPRSRGDHRPHRRLPGRDRRRLPPDARGRRRGGVRRRVHVRVLAPAGNARRRDVRRARRRPRSRRSACGSWSRWWSATPSDRHQARVGRVEEVLVDGPSKKDPSVLSGRTRQNKLVHFAAPDGASEPGALVDVRIVDAAPHWLRGDVVRVVESPRRTRTRIPVAVV